jgi:hypothetical protein
MGTAIDVCASAAGNVNVYAKFFPAQPVCLNLL